MQTPACARCGKTEAQAASPLDRCAGCRAVVYCSRACQAHDWKHGGHKQACKKLGARQRLKQRMAHGGGGGGGIAWGASGDAGLDHGDALLEEGRVDDALATYKDTMKASRGTTIAAAAAARSNVRIMPPMGASALMRPRTRFASVTVGSVLPSP